MSTYAEPKAIFLRRRDVEEMVGLSRSTLYAMISRGEFPEPIRVGAKAVRWSSSEILTWMSERTVQRG
ncbi:helix-turn-helix transcriptional regulator [Achromobacter insolitus]|uniref:helix-turn-helix transcriptional regulator n=1 Tax=Achromobacter insolitus TaxID=217204 RepID=UPI0023AF36C0|nr:AlpA family phage regulatory protein [Achromobacter insolitus]